MKRLIERIVCIALVVSFVLPNVTAPKVKAANVFSPIGTVTILVEKDPFPSGVFSADVPEIEEQLEQEAFTDLPVNASDWIKLRYYDHLPWGEIHKRVQDDIWTTNSDPIQVGELRVRYDLNTTNKQYKYLNKKTAGEKGTYGYADMYATDNNINYLWEVKPESYRWLNKSKGEKQLQKYVDVGIPETPVVALMLGPKSMIKPADVKKHEFDFGLTLLGANAIEVWEERVNYHVKYEVMNNSLIIYEFKRTSQKNTLAPGFAPLYAGKKALDTFLDKLKKYQDGEETDLEPAGESAFSYESEYATEQAWEIVKDGAIVTGGIVATGAVIYSIPKLKTLLNLLKANYVVHEPNTGKNTISGPIAGAAAVVIGVLDPIVASAASDDEYVAIDGSSEFHQSLEEVLLYLYPEDPSAIEEYYYSEDESTNCIEDIKNQSSNYDKAGKANPPRDPLIIHFSDTKEIEFSTLDDGVNFDLDNNGFAEKTAWIVNNDGFLVYDVNGNRIVDNGSELFGDQFAKPDGKVSSTGAEAILSLDENGDGILDESDSINDRSVFENLYVWFDSKRNGNTDENELVPIKDLGVSYIDLAFAPDNQNNINETGTRREESSYVYFKDEAPRKISEFWFPVNSSDTTHEGVVTSGNVPSIEQAIAEDDSLYLLQICILFSRETDIAKKHSYLKQILYYITDSTDISINSRGGNIDARDLHVVEQFMGREFEGVDGSNPNINAANILKDIYSDIEELYYNHLNLKLLFKGYRSTIYEYLDENDSKSIELANIKKVIETKINNNEDDADVLVHDLGIYLKIYDKFNGTSEFAKYCQYCSELGTHYAEIAELSKSSNTYIGTSQNNTYTGTSSADFIFGSDGNDTLCGFAGNDYIYGESGNDTLRGNTGDDTYIIEMSHGNEVIYDTEGENVIFFADYFTGDDYSIAIDVNSGFVMTNKDTDETISLPDFLTNPVNYDFIFNGETQTLGGGESREVIEGTAENNYLEASDGFNVFYGGDGNDTLAGGANMDFMYGENGDDLLIGRNGVNVLFGGTGNDTIYDGDDGSYLNGGDGDDSLYGGGGADVLDGGAGNDYLQADHGNDTYVFGKGYDTDTINASSDLNTVIVHGYRSTDMINTRNAHNDLIINFKNSDDCLIIDHFFDYNSNRDFNFVFDDGTVLGQYDITAKYAPIDGTDADEWLAIQNSDDGIIHGNGGNDGVSGGSGNDELYGDSGDDTLYGNDGNDILDGGTGTDGLNGGNGTDTYIFAKGYGNDTVNEWGSDHSIIKLTDINSDEVTVTDQYGSNLLLSVIDTEDTLVISNFKWGQATYTFEFADGAVATVNKDTWVFEFSQLPVVSEEEEVTTSDTTTVTDETIVETEVSVETTENEEVQSTEESDTSVETENTDSGIIVETDDTTTDDLVDEFDSTETEEVTEQNDSQEADAAENVSEDVTEETGSNIIDETEASVETDVTE